MNFSVIITAYNQHYVTMIHLREIMLGTVLPNEIIVVNDHGDHNLKEMIQSLDLKCPVTYAYIDQDIMWNYTGARNLGIWLSHGDYLLFEDTDNIPKHDAYETIVNYVLEHPEVDRFRLGWRSKVYKVDLDKPSEEWVIQKGMGPHDDTMITKRAAVLKLKGYDERFAGRYGWQSSDWKRRYVRAGLVLGDIKDAKYFGVRDGETPSCEHVEERLEAARDEALCTICNLPARRMSGKNYQMAREKDGHYQSKSSILNFTFTYETL